MVKGQGHLYGVTFLICTGLQMQYCHSSSVQTVTGSPSSLCYYNYAPVQLLF